MPRRQPELPKWFKELIPPPGEPSPWVQVEIPDSMIGALLDERDTAAPWPDDHQDLPAHQRVWRRLRNEVAEDLGRRLEAMDWAGVEGMHLVGFTYQWGALSEAVNALESRVQRYREQNGKSYPADSAAYVYTTALYLGTEKSEPGQGDSLVFNAWSLLLGGWPAFRELQRRATEQGPDGKLTDRAKQIALAIWLLTVDVTPGTLPVAYEAVQAVFHEDFSPGLDPVSIERESLHLDPARTMGSVFYMFSTWYEDRSKLQVLAEALDGKLADNIVKRTKGRLKWDEERSQPTRRGVSLDEPVSKGTDVKRHETISVEDLHPDVRAPIPTPDIREFLEDLFTRAGLAAWKVQLLWEQAQGATLRELADKYDLGTPQNVRDHLERMKRLLREMIKPE